MQSWEFSRMEFIEYMCCALKYAKKEMGISVSAASPDVKLRLSFNYDERTNDLNRSNHDYHEAAHRLVVGLFVCVDIVSLVLFGV